MGSSGTLHQQEATQRLNRGGGTRLQPRLIRLKDAPFYLGMSRQRFNDVVRPYLTPIDIGERCIAFDRLDLDAWVDHYKSRNGRLNSLEGENLWDAKEPLDSIYAMESGTLISKSEESAFAKVLEKSSLQRRSSISSRRRKKSGKRRSTESDRKGLSARPPQST